MHDLRALVVDDSKVGRLTMMKKLEAMGVKVDLAESGQQALDYLAQHRPGVIFMDHMMPDLDGFEVTRRIKASPATRDIPVIVISGNEGEAFVAEARAAGAIDAIVKPPVTEVLEALLAALTKPVAEAAASTLPETAAEVAVTAPRPPAPAPVPLPPAPVMDPAELRALVASLVGPAVEQRLAGPLAELQTRVGGLAPELQNLRQAMPDLRARGEAQAALAEQRAAEQDRRLSGLAQDLARVSQDVQALAAAQSALAQQMTPNMAQRVGRLEQRVEALAQAPAPVPVVAAEPAVPAAIQAELAELSRLKARVKTLTTLTLIGGAALLAVIGVVLLRG